MNKLILFLIIPLFCNGQIMNVPDYEDTTMPLNPEEAAFTQYAHSPVSLARGELNFSVPIHTVKGKDLSLPIYMSYRQGVKIHDVSQYTGQGWTLFAGGVITRRVNDLLDNSSKPRFDWKKLIGDIGNHNVDEIDADVQSLHVNNLDGGFDEFSYNFNGYSGEFILDDDLSTPVFIKEQRNWTVDIQDNEIVIITEDGTQYIFGEIRRDSYDHRDRSYNDITVSWYLTKIISPRVNETIELSYDRADLVYPRVKNDYLQVDPLLLKTTEFNDPNDYDAGVIEQNRIKEISLMSNGNEVSKVTFVDSAIAREDTYGTLVSYPLGEIQIFNDPNSSTPLKIFKFDIENVNSDRLFLRSIQEFSGDESTSKPPYQFEYYKEDDLPSRTSYKADHWGYYSQDYGTKYPYSYIIPWRHDKTREVDIGTVMYGSLIRVDFPTGGYKEIEYESNEYYTEGSAFSNSNTENLSIWWDTADNRWEQGWGDDPANILSRNFTVNNEQYIWLHFEILLEKGLGTNEGLLCDEARETSVSIFDSTGHEIFKAYFVTSEGSEEPVTMRVYAENYITGATANAIAADTNFNLPTFTGHIPSLFSEFLNDPNINFNSYARTGLVGDEFDRSLFLKIQPGTYTAKIEASDIINHTESGSKISLDFNYSNSGQTTTAIPAAGIRVASQTIQDPVTNKDYSIYYDYSIHTNGVSTGSTSGKISQEPIIPLDNSYNSFPSPGTGREVIRYRLNALTRHIENSWVYYSDVKEHNGIGHTIHKFYVPSYQSYKKQGEYTVYNWGLIGGNIVPVPNLPTNIWTTSWPNNYSMLTPYDDEFAEKQISKSVYKSGGFLSDDILIQKEEFEYEFNHDRDYLYTGLLEVTDNASTYALYRYSLNKLDLGFALLTGEKITNYDENGENPIVSRTNYSYRPDVYTPNKIITTDSKGEKIIKKIKTNRDYLSSTTFDNDSSLNMENLNNEGFIWPIEEQIWRVNTSTGNYKLIDGKVYIYDDISESGSAHKLYQPTKHLKLKLGDIDSDDAATFISDFNNNNNSNITWLNGVDDYEYEEDVNLTYDVDGNLKQVSKEDSNYYVYIWGYNNQYPIAKIENATYSQTISSQVANLQSKSNLDDDTCLDSGSCDEKNLRAALTTLRNSLPDSMVTTYTYNPLIGITSVTDPKGYTMYYEYDDFNRLKHVKDADGNILSKNEYNYKLNN